MILLGHILAAGGAASDRVAAFGTGRLTVKADTIYGGFAGVALANAGVEL
jgi:hypothetical protein